MRSPSRRPLIASVLALGVADYAAHLLSVSRAAIYRLLGSEEIEAAKSGHKTMVIVTSLTAFVERNRVEIRSASQPDGGSESHSRTP